MNLATWLTAPLPILLLAAIGVVAIYRFAAPLRFRRLPRGLVAGEVDAEFDLLDGLSRHCNVEVFENNRVELLLNGDAIFSSMLEAIEEAEHTIDFLTYVFWQGRIARTFASALADAATRGVRVRVLLDGYGAGDMPQEVLDEMADAGCRVVVFNPIRLFSLHRANFRTHRKVMVVDEVVGYTGGVGIADEWSGDARDESEWRDNHFRIQGPAVRYLQTSFEENWRYATGEVVIHARHDRERETPEGADARITPLLGRPGLGVSKIALANWFAIHHASHRLWIQTPYYVPSDDLQKALMAAAQRGVDVRLMIPGRQCDSSACRFAALRRVPDLVHAGVRVLIYERSMMHAKTVLTDDDLCLVGSSNLDHRSFELNYEMLLAVEDGGLHQELATAFEADMEHCSEMSLEDVTNLGWADKLRMHWFSFFRYHL